MESYTLFADGGARGNPGPAGAGAVVYDNDQNIVGEISKFLGEKTNNWAEYEALICGLGAIKKQAKELSNTTVVVKLDSELIVKQMRGEYKVKHPELKKQFARVQDLIVDFAEVTFTHVPREENTVADQLANDAMDRGS